MASPVFDTPQPRLLTGATGQIGSECVRRLNACGVVPLALMRRPLPPGAWGEARVEEVPGDLADLAAGAPLPALREALGRVRVVYHLAARVNLAGRGPEEMERINALAPPRLFALAREAGVRRFVHVSTTGAVGCSRQPLALDEDAPYNLAPFHNPYFDTKRAAEESLLAAWRAAPEPTELIVLNPSITLGPPGSFRRLARPRRSRPLPPPGDWRYKLVCFWFAGGVNLVDVRDAADGILRAAERGTPGQRYILGGENLSVHALMEIFAEVFGAAGPRVRLPLGTLRAAGALAEGWSRLTGHRARLNRVLTALAGRYWFYDSSRAMGELGFRPRSLRTTLRDLAAAADASRPRNTRPGDSLRNPTTAREAHP
jgi:dihydroflavonol-4-reductase